MGCCLYLSSGCHVWLLEEFTSGSLSLTASNFSKSHPHVTLGPPNPRFLAFPRDAPPCPCQISVLSPLFSLDQYNPLPCFTLSLSHPSPPVPCLHLSLIFILSPLLRRIQPPSLRPYLLFCFFDSVYCSGYPEHYG